MQVRRGRIDEVEDLSSLDLIRFNNSINPWNNQYITGGFRPGARHFRSTLEKWGFTGHATVVDIGAGYGRWAVFLAEVNERVLGFERNGAAVELARKLADFFALPNVTFETALVSDIPAEDNIADAAWCFNGLHLFPRAATLAEARRLLKPGGRLFLGAYNGLGTILEKFVEGYERGGLDDHVTRFALQAMKDSGKPEAASWTYADADRIGDILEHFSFELADGTAIELQHSAQRSTASRFADDLADVPSLAERLASDKPFREDFIQDPEVARTHPINLNILAIRR